MLDIDAVNFLFEERSDLKARGEFAKIISSSGGWNGPALYKLLINKHLVPYWSLIRGTNPSFPKICSSSFSGKDLSGVDLSGLSFSSCRFLNARLEGCDLRNTSFSKCSFTNTLLRETRWSKSRAYNCDFRRALVEGANFSGLVFRKCKMPPHLPGHRSHARKGQETTSAGDNLYPGQVRVFSIEGDNLKECFLGIGQSIYYSVDNRSDVSAEACFVSGSDAEARSDYIRSSLTGLVPGVKKIIIGGDFSSRASREMFLGLFTGAKVPCKVFFVENPEDQCEPSEGFSFINYLDSP